MTGPSRDRTRAGGRPSLGAPFLTFWAGYSASNLADGVLLTALPLLAVALTDDPLLISGLTAVWYLPWLLFGLPAGALADRLPRLRSMAAANAVRAAIGLALFLLTLFGHANILLLYTAMFLLVTCETLYDTAGKAALPQLVDRPALDRANGRLEAGRSVAEDFLGGPAAGLLFAVAAALPLALNSGMYLASALVLLAVVPRRRREGTPRAAPRAAQAPRPRDTGARAPDGPDPAPGAPAGLFRETAAALAFIRRTPDQRTLLLSAVVAAAAAAVFNAVLVIYALDALHVPERFYGVFLSAAAVGALAAAVAVEAAAARLSRSVLLVGGHALLALALGSLALATGFLTGALALAAVSFAITVVNIQAVTVLQSITPNHVLGRVVSVRRTLTRGLSPLFAVGGGLLARVDLHLPMFVAGGAALVVLAVFGRALAAAARGSERPAPV